MLSFAERPDDKDTVPDSLKIEVNRHATGGSERITATDISTQFMITAGVARAPGTQVEIDCGCRLHNQCIQWHLEFRLQLQIFLIVIMVEIMTHVVNVTTTEMLISTE